MPQEVKPVMLRASIDVETAPADLQTWDAQAKILKNTGIERDGGITNLYAAIESNTLYDETFFTQNGRRVRLLRDDVNDRLQVFTNEKEIGQVPQWAVDDRRILSVDASDVLATVDDTLLVLRISSGKATIEEVDSEDFALIQTREFTIPANVSDGMLVRNKAPTWANVTSIVAVFASGTKLNHEIITDAGVVYSITSQLGFVNSSQVFAYYQNGWIVSANDPTDGRTFLLKSDGSQQGTYTEAVYLVANYDQGTDAVTFRGWRDVVALGTPATIGNGFTPPVVPGGTWTIAAITGAATSPAAVLMTAGGYALAYGASPKSLYYHNNDLPRLWTIGHATPPEIYGYLDNGADFAVKSHTILGAASYLSASFAADGIGVPITEVGELNAYYYPQILKATSGEYRIIYRRGDGAFATVCLTKNPTGNRMQEIAPGVVKINTISGLCVADANDNDLQFGGNAYNGFVVVGFDAVTPVQKAFVARYRGDFGGSVDTGYKSTSAVTVGAVNLVVIPEGLSYSPNNETIDVYVGTPPASINYYRSIRDGFAQSVKGALTGTLYVDDQVIPPPIGARYAEQTIALVSSTAIREQNYDGYALLNEAKGQYQSFRLFSQLYLFDGAWIYAAVLSANTLTQIVKVAQGLGLVFLAESPTAIYFYSTFDNSLYSFDGGQSVTKQMRMNQRGTIRSGVYNVRENTLAMFGDDFVLWLRDGILSETALPFAYPFSAFSTSDGIWITRDDYAIKYVYNPIAGGGGGLIITLDLDGGVWGTVYADAYDGGVWGTVYPDTIVAAPWGSGDVGTVVPLVWRSRFLGFSDRIRQSIDRYFFRVYKEDLAESELVVEYESYREDGRTTETRSIQIGTPSNPYDADGYAVVEFIPANKNAIAASIQITCNDKILILAAFATVSTAGDSVAKNRG